MKNSVVAPSTLEKVYFMMDEVTMNLAFSVHEMTARVDFNRLTELLPHISRQFPFQKLLDDGLYTPPSCFSTPDRNSYITAHRSLLQMVPVLYSVGIRTHEWDYDITSDLAGKNVLGRAYYRDSQGRSNDPVVWLNLDPSALYTILSIEEGRASLNAILQLSSLQTLTRSSMLESSDLIMMIALMHEYGHILEVLLCMSDLRKSRDPEISFIKASRFIQSERIRQGRDCFFLGDAIEPAELASVNRWINSSSYDEKVATYARLTGGTDITKITEADIASFCVELKVMAKRVYQNLSSEIFANLFAGYCIKNIPIMSQAYKRAIDLSEC